MTNSNSNKEYWTPKQVFMHLEMQQKKRIPFSIPNNVYCTSDFKWNEVLFTNDKFFQMPTMEILENLQSIVSLVIQPLRTKIGKPIRINSSWRTPAKQQDLIKQHKAGILKTRPSETSLHLEGLAMDITVVGDTQKELQSIVNNVFAGETEFDWDCTHIGLITFSKAYLQRNGLLRDDIYRKLILDTTKLPKSQRDKIEKRLDPTNWAHQYPSTFNASKNAEFFKNSNIGKRDVETTPRLPEVKIPLPDENKAEDNIIDDAWNSTDTQSGNKPYLEGHVEEDVYNESNANETEGTQTGYAANMPEQNDTEETELPDGIADSIERQKRELQNFIDRLQPQADKNNKTGCRLEDDELYRRLKRERGHVEVRDASKYTTEQLIEDTLKYGDILRQFCRSSDTGFGFKSDSVTRAISDVKQNPYYTHTKTEETPKPKHSRFLNFAHEAEIEQVVSGIFDSVIRELGYDRN